MRITTSLSDRFPLITVLRIHCGPVLTAMLFAESNDALVIGDQQTSKLDRRRNQKPVRRVAVFEVMELIAAGCGFVT